MLILSFQKIKNAFLILYILVINVSHLQSQQLNFEQTHIDDLPFSYNEFIKMDSRGLIWISSINGAYCFNGINWKYYKLNYDGNIQSDFFEESNGNIWLSTYKGIHHYNRIRDEFTSFQLIESNEKNANIDYHIFHLENDGKLWLKINGSIYSYHSKKKVLKKHISTKGIRFSIDIDEHGNLKRIISCPWLLDSGFEVFEIRENQELEKKKYWDKSVIKRNIEINSAFIQKNKDLILSTNLGLAHWDASFPNSAKLTPLPKNIFSLARKSQILNKKEILIPFKNKGIWIYDIINKQFKSRLAYPNNHFHSKTLSIRSIYLDSNKHLWVSDEGNRRVSFLRLNPNKFYNPLQQNNENSKILSIEKDKKGRIWCASESDGIFIFENDLSLLKRFQNIKSSKLSTDSFNNIWSLEEQQIRFFNLVTNKWEQVINNANINLFDLIHLSFKRKLLSTSDGIYELYLENRNWNFKKSPIFKDSKGFEIHHMLSGEFKYHYLPSSSNSIKLLTKGKIDTISEVRTNSLVFGVCEDSYRQKTWLATTKGLAYFDWLSKTITYINNDLLSSQNITNINIDNQNSIWITNEKELFRYYPNLDRLYVFRKEELNLSTNFALSIKCKTLDGQIWLGTNNGLVVFHPDSIKPYSFKPSIYIEALKVNNEPYDTKKSLNELQSLILKYKQNTIDIGLIATSYHLAKYNKINYRLKNYNDSWITIESGTTARFTQIPPGNYTLEIKGINVNGVKGKPRIININIAYPFWQTWWFPILVLLGIICISLAIAHLYIRQKLKAQQIEMDKRAALNQQRNAIANDLHDDIGNDLSQIISMSDLALIKEQEESNRLLNEIADLATESVKNLRYTMWSLDEKNNALSTILFKLREYAHLFAKRHGLQLVLEFPNQIPEQDLEGKQRRELFLFFKEALNNIKKYAEASTIDIVMKISDSNLNIQIKDNGKGFNLDKQKGTGKGLLTMEERAINLNGQLVIKTAPQQGTCLTINIPIS